MIKSKTLGDREIHPYGEFIPSNATVMIVGSFPIGKFTNPNRKNEINNSEVDFFYGGSGNVLWNLVTEALNADIDILSRVEIKRFLAKYCIAVGDVIKSCKRLDGSASDSELREIEFNKKLKDKLNTYNIKTLIFTSKKVVKWFHCKIDDQNNYEYYTILSPSAQGPRSIGKLTQYKEWKKKHSDKGTIEYRRIKTIKLFKKIFIDH